MPRTIASTGKMPVRKARMREASDARGAEFVGTARRVTRLRRDFPIRVYSAAWCAYTRFDEAFTQAIQLRLELGRQSIAGHIEDEGHALPARIVPEMSPPVGARNTPNQAQCLYVVYLRRIRAKMLLK